jgi:hypothetical protein
MPPTDTGTKVTSIESPIVHQIAVPAAWHLGGHGDPVAEFDYLQLRLHEDGTVTWVRDAPTKGD